MISLIQSLHMSPGWPCPPGVTNCPFPHPILYFGNEVRYKGSETRIITLSLNPSDKEFTGNRFQLISGVGPHTTAAYKAAFDKYFDLNPYWQWFNNYEKALNGLNASYHGHMSAENYDNASIHIDLIPIATYPVWSRLNPNLRNQLINSYKKTLQDLVDNLDPHYILTSMSRKNFDYFLNSIGANIIDRVYYVKNNMIVSVIYKVHRAGKSLHTIITGINRNTPFAFLTHTEKKNIVEHSVNPCVSLANGIQLYSSTKILYPQCKI